MSGKVMRPKRSPPAGAGALGVAALPVACSDRDEVDSLGFEMRLKRSLLGVAAGCVAPKRLEVPPNPVCAG